MGVFDYFRKKLSDGDSVSPGGSQIIRHGEKKSGWMPAIPPTSTLPFVKRREQVYSELFGEPVLVYDDLYPGLVPHIDIYVHEPDEGRDFYTLITGGMSDMPMKVPSDAPPEMPRRAEMVFYLPPTAAPQREYVTFLSTCARFVYDYDTWLYWGHTIPNGDPPAPIFPGTSFVAVLYLFPLLMPDRVLGEHLALDGDPVHLLWPVPLTLAEHRLKLEKGTRALEEAFNRSELPFVFDEQRESCV